MLRLSIESANEASDDRTGWVETSCYNEPVALASFVVPSKAKNNGRHQVAKVENTLRRNFHRFLVASGSAWAPPARRSSSLRRIFAVANHDLGVGAGVWLGPRKNWDHTKTFVIPGNPERSTYEGAQIDSKISRFFSRFRDVMIVVPAFRFATSTNQRGKNQPSAQQYRETKQQRSRSFVRQTRK